MAVQLHKAQPRYITIEVLRIPQIPKRSRPSRLLNKNELQTDQCQGIPGQKVARTREDLPSSSIETLGNLFVLPNTIGSKIPSNSSSPSSDPVIPKSTYVTFPEYQRTVKPERHVIKRSAKKLKLHFLNLGNRIIGGLEALGHFYASSEHKWQCEYAPLEPLPSQSTVLEAIDAADKATKLERARKSKRKSPWSKNLQRLWKSEDTNSTAGLSTNILSTKDDEELSKKAQATSTVPSISEQLLSQTKNRPQHIQSSHNPCQPVLRTTNQRQQLPSKPQHVSRLPLPRQRCFSPPRGRMYPLERQPKRRSNDVPSPDQQASLPAHSSHVTQQQQQIPPGGHDPQKEGKILTEEQKLPYRKANEEGVEINENIGTPWSGLETVAEEQLFFGTTADIIGGVEEHGQSLSRSRTDVADHTAETVTQNKVEGERAIDCDGFEAGGEFCLRHESCAREAMALGYACLPA